MFMPVIERKRRADWRAGAELRDAADDTGRFTLDRACKKM